MCGCSISIPDSEVTKRINEQKEIPSFETTCIVT